MQREYKDLPEDVLFRINLLCDLFERQWVEGKRPAAESFARRANIQSDYRGALIKELRLLEVELRRVYGRSVPLEDVRRHLFKAELVKPDKLASLIESEGPQDGAALVERLRAKNRLTEFQAKTLLGEMEISSLRLGSYTLIDFLGAGAMGNVYLAFDRIMKRRVAVKMMRPNLRRDPQVLKRFHREIAAAARLNHPRLAAAYEADEGQAYLAMEFVDGANLAKVVSENGPLPVAEAHKYALQAAEALEHAHQRGVIHRDVKPSNIMRDKDGDVKVLDVGLARLLPEQCSDETQVVAETELTGDRTKLGTFHFMSPEQAEDPHAADQRSDVYSLGCTLYFLLTGSPPYPDKVGRQLLDAHRRAPIPKLVVGDRPAPAALNRVFQKMLAKKPADRHPDMTALIDDLRSVEPALTRRDRRSTYKIALAAIGAAAICALLVTAFSRGKTASPMPFPVERDVAAKCQRDWAEALDLPPFLRDEETKMDFAFIPPGRFTMGCDKQESETAIRYYENPREYTKLIASEHPPRWVDVSEAFYLGQTEVTYAQFEIFVEAEGYVTEIEDKKLEAFGLKGEVWRKAVGYCWKCLGEYEPAPDHPVSNITRGDAEAYCRWATEVTGYKYRLPTEEQWEYACRAGTSSTWHWGNDATKAKQYGWFKPETTPRPSNSETLHPVKKPPANAFGLYDMHGNIAEWCRDEYAHPKFSEDKYYVLRGGACMQNVYWARSAARNARRPNDPTHAGFRVMRSVRPQ